MVEQRHNSSCVSSCAPMSVSLFELAIPLRTLYGTAPTINHLNVCISLLLHLSRERWQFLAHIVVKAARRQLYNFSEGFLEFQLSPAVQIKRVTLLVGSSTPNALLRTTSATFCIIHSASLHPPYEEHIHRHLRLFFLQVLAVSSMDIKPMIHLIIIELPFQSLCPCISLDSPNGADSQYIESSQSYTICISVQSV